MEPGFFSSAAVNKSDREGIQNLPFEDNSSSRSHCANNPAGSGETQRPSTFRKAHNDCSASYSPVRSAPKWSSSTRNSAADFQGDSESYSAVAVASVPSI